MEKPLIRVTAIEAFRRWTEQSEYDNFEITEQSVIDSVSGHFTGNDLTRIGTAFHSIVESGSPQYSKAPAGIRTFTRYGKPESEPVPEGRTFTVGGFPVTLDTGQCRTALRYRAEHPGAFHEVRESKDYGPAVVTGCADMIHGTEIRDIKTKFFFVRDTDYTSSCQWRFYLDIFQADTFRFDIFQFQGYDAARHGSDVRGLPLTRRTPAITCRRYGHMQQDLSVLLSEFLRWAQARRLMQYLAPRKI